MTHGLGLLSVRAPTCWRRRYLCQLYGRSNLRKCRVNPGVLARIVEYRGVQARPIVMSPHAQNAESTASSSTSSPLSYFSSSNSGGKLQRFIEMIDDPDKVDISARDAKRKFSLTDEDLDRIGIYRTTEDPFDSRRQCVEMYWIPDVAEYALGKHGRDRLILEYQAYLRSSMPADVKRKIYGSTSAGWKLRRYYLQPSTKTIEGRDSLTTGLAVNSTIFSIKALAYVTTNSQALFAEMMHSAADVANYTYRLVQLRRSESAGDRDHPYGYAPLRYITADRSFTLLAMLGCVVPAQQALRILWLQQACDMNLSDACTAISILACSMALESIAARTSWRELTREAAVSKNSTLMQLRHGRDVMTIATFCEAVCGVLGGAVGIVGVWTTYSYQLAAFDATASLMMSGLVGMTSWFLLNKSQQALLGRTLPEHTVLCIIHAVLADPVVNDIQDVKTEVVGTTTARFKAEVSFNAEAITRKSAFSVKYPPAFMKIPLSIGEFPDNAEFAEWLEQNNADFLVALTVELKRIERIIRAELSVFPNVHVDLEPT